MRPERLRLWLRGALIAGVLALSPLCLLGAGKANGDPATIGVSGLGWWKNRELRLTLDRLLGEERGPTMDANAVEDAVFLIVSSLETDGFLKPRITAVLAHADGGESRHEFDAGLTTLLPRPMSVTMAKFEIERGVRSTFHEVRFSGLSAIPEDDARALFRPGEMLWLGAAERAYSPGRLRRGLDVLQEQLQQLGYAEAGLATENLVVDESTGRVSVDISATEGPRWRVASLRHEDNGGTDVTMESIESRTGVPWNFLWQQDVSAAIRQRYYHAGYPDVTVRLSREADPVSNGERAVHVVAAATPGPQVTVGEVIFTGEVRTRQQVLRRRVTAEPGDLLNPLSLERMRYRLGQLGIFESVELRYEPANGTVRDVVFVLDEAPRWDVSLLLGYGSYEQLRGGIELRQSNLFGRAHQSRLQLVQSLKSSRGEYTYTVPELFGEMVDGSVRLFGFQREEQAFVRQEYGGSVTLRRPAPLIRADATVGYTFQALRSKDNELETREVDDTQVTVASVDLGLTHDARDNPLRPRQGYRWFAQLESASKVFGGEVDYQRFEFGLALHKRIGRGRWWHAGLTHGLLTTYGADTDRDLPVNKRFYPGGDSSIRGYQVGEAAPLAPDGRFIGAKTYTLLNLEFEQTVTGNWSAVLFVDGLGIAARLADYPFDERLVSAGVGIRYQTLIGPLRLEYGRNLSRREGDPGGTLHFSIGFPF